MPKKCSPKSANGIERIAWHVLTVGFGKHFGAIPVTKHAEAAYKFKKRHEINNQQKPREKDLRKKSLALKKMQKAGKIIQEKKMQICL